MLNIHFLNSLYVVSIFSFLLSVILLHFGCTLAFLIKYFQLIRERPKAEKSALQETPDELNLNKDEKNRLKQKPSASEVVYVLINDLKRIIRRTKGH